MQIRVLGPVEVVDEDSVDGMRKNNEATSQIISIGGPIPHRLLALLVASGSRGVSVETLVEQLWQPATPPIDPVASIRTYVARLRTTLGADSIETGPSRYKLNGSALTTDIVRFEQLIGRARRASGSPTAAELWRQALDLWRGPAFGDQADLDSVRLEATRLEELRAEATEAWIDALLAGGAGRELVADVEAAVAEFPLREGFRVQQMTVLGRSGRQPDALRAFQEFRADLTEIGLEPSQRLVELDRQIAAGEVPRSGAGRTLRGYELGDRLGEGAFAVVYEATQVSVGRSVAVKQIRAKLADQPEFIRQFEAEAHLVARLEHPHIVPLYDYWREPGSAYLIMRYLEGGSLQNRALSGAMDLEEYLPIVTQVAAGLATAHEAGVIHRDVKPANILLDGAGNAYLTDFGIAVEEEERIDPEARMSNGSPAYAPPEQLRRQPVGPSADVYALGVTTYEMLTARLPFPSETTMAGLLERQLNDPVPLVRSSRPEIPAAVDAVIQKATAKRPEERYQSPLEFVSELAVAAGLDSQTTSIEPQERNPYKGLRSFDEADAADFVSRDRLVSQLISNIQRNRMVMVVGPSGSGKSSVVRAGLLPAVRRGRVLGSDRWLVSDMVPGSNPLAALETALLRVAVDPPADVLGVLGGDPRGLSRLIRQLIPEGRELLLLIDQFEELFVLSSDADRRLMLEALVAATTGEDPRLRVIATIRADFYDHPLSDPAFAELIHGTTVAVRPLAPDELERTITEPAKAVGASFEPGLVAKISADVADQPGALPLLQYALTELYNRREGNVLTTKAYVELGGVAGAVTRRAEEVFGQMTPSEQSAAHQILIRMVTAGEGAEDTRRRVLRSELSDDQATTIVLRQFGDARLVAFDRDPRSREPTVEVAHEALIREWPRLRAWLDEGRDGLRILRHLTETADGWSAGGRQEGELYRGGRLESLATWASDHRSELNEIESEFLAASLARQVSEDEMELRTTRRLRHLLAGAAVVAAVALVAGGLALVQRGKANEAASQATQSAAFAQEQRKLASENAAEATKSADLAKESEDLAEENAALATANAATAETRRMIADAANLTEGNLEIALLLAAEAYNRDPSPSGLAGLQRVLTQAGSHLGVLGPGTVYVDVHWTGSRVVGVAAGRVDVFDAETGMLEQEIVLPELGELVDSTVRDDFGNVSRLDGTLLVLKPGGERVLLVDIASGEVGQLQHTVKVTSVAVDESRGLVAVGDAERKVTLYQVTPGQSLDAATASLITRWSIEGFAEQGFHEIEFPNDVKLSNVPFYEELFRSFEPWIFGIGVNDVMFGPEGDVFAATGIHIRRFDVENGEKVAEAIAMSAAEGVLLPTFPGSLSVDGNQVVSASITGSVLFNAGLSQTFDIPFDRGRLDGNVLALGARALRSDPHSFVSILSDGNLSFAREENGGVVTSLMSTRAAKPVDLAISSDEKAVAIVGGDGITLVALAGQQLLASAVPRAGHLLPSISPNGQRVTVSSLGTALPAVTHDLETGEMLVFESGTISSLGPVGSPVIENLWFVSDNEVMAIGRQDRSQPYSGYLLDGKTFELRMELPGYEFGERVSPDGKLLVVGKGRGGDRDAPLVLFFIDLETYEVVYSLNLASWAGSAQVDRNLRNSTFSVDGTRLLSTFPSGRAVVIDVASRTVLESFAPEGDGSGGITTAVFSPDGLLLATRDGVGSIDIRDANTYEILFSLAGGTDSSENLTLGPYFSPDSKYLLTTREQRPRLWDLETRTDLGTFPVEEGLGIEGSTGLDHLNLVTGVGESILIWNLETDEWFDIACQAAGRNLTRAEWAQFGPADSDYRDTCSRWS